MPFRRDAASRSRAAGSSARRRSAAAASWGCAATPGGSTSAHPAAAASSRSRRRPSGDGTTIAAERRSSARAEATTAVRTWMRSRRRIGIDGRAASRAVRTMIASQSGSSRSARSAARTTGSPAADVSITTRFRFGAGRKRSTSTPAGTTVNAPGNRSAARVATSSEVASSVSIRAQEPVAVVPSRREAEPLGVDERRGGRGLGLEQRDVRQPGHRRVEPVHDVEVAPAERSGDVRADADRDPDCGAGRDRHRA